MIAAARRAHRRRRCGSSRSGRRGGAAASTGRPTAALERAHPACCGEPRPARWRATGARPGLGPRLRPLGGLLLPRPRPWRARLRRRRAARGPRRDPAQRRGHAAAGDRRRHRRRRRLPRSPPSSSTTAAVEIGQPGYAGLPDVAEPPTVDVRTAGEAHAYLLVPLGPLAALLGLPRCAASAAAGAGRGRPRTRRAGGDPARRPPARARRGSPDVPLRGRHGGARGRLLRRARGSGGAGLAGLLYYARPCRIRINSSGRAASARRRRPRRRDSSRARVARSA